MYICNNINNSIRKNSHSSYQTSEHQHDDKLNISDAKTKQYISSLVGFKEPNHQPPLPPNTVLISKSLGHNCIIHPQGSHSSFYSIYILLDKYNGRHGRVAKCVEFTVKGKVTKN